MPSKTAEWRNMDTEELEHRLDETRRELFNLRFQLATGRLDNIARITAIRREIAQVHTLRTERGIDSDATKEQ